MGSIDMLKGRERAIPYLFLLPTALLFVAFILFPLGASLYYSLTEYNYVFSGGPEFNGLGNYAQLFSDRVFLKALQNTGYFAVLFFPSLIILSLFTAVLVHQEPKGAAAFRTSIFLPVILALSLSGVMFQWMLDPRFGLLNSMLGRLVGTNVKIAWLSNDHTVIFSIVMVSVWKFAGMNMVIFLAGLSAIPKAIYEAARIDGANFLQQFFLITIPNLKESFILTSIWGIIQSLKVFELPFVMTGGGPGNASLVLYQYMWRNAFEYFEMGYASSIGFIIGGTVLLFSLLNLMGLRTERK